MVEAGPAELCGRTVFCLYPHQTRYVVPATAVTVVPADVPSERAVLAGTVETAINLAWDARPWVGERQLSALGISIGEQVRTGVHVSPANARYLATKADLGGPLIDLDLMVPVRRLDLGDATAS